MSYPRAIHDFVLENMNTLDDYELADKCNELFHTEFDKGKMMQFRKNHKYRRAKSSKVRVKRKSIYPDGMYEFVRDNSQGVSVRDMTRRVNEKFGTDYTEMQIGNYRKRHKIRCGIDTRFKKGQISANTGRRMEDFMSPEAMERARSTQFKKGSKPHNQLPLGTIIENTEGYYMKKVSMTGTQHDRWKFLHKLVWEEHNGPIPKGMIISFKDRNKKNCDISNLMMITFRENQNLNSYKYRSENPELTELGLNLVRLRLSLKDKKGHK